MAGFVFVCFTILIVFKFSEAISTKMDFFEEQESSSLTNSSKDSEDVEVQHTIVVSTKLRNNNRQGLQSSRGDSVRNSGQTSNIKREDSGEVPVIKGNKALETTQIFSPDTRLKLPVTSVNEFTRPSPPDEYDIYPNMAINPVQFKPSSFYNNANWWSQDDTRNFNAFVRRNDRTGYVNTQKSGPNRGMSDDSVREFYCKKCREMNGRAGIRGCEQLRRSNPWYSENTTPKIRIDGKIVKLN